MANEVQPTYEELLAKLNALESKQKTQGSGYKVSIKGALSRYGLGRFPVTLYASQWRQVIADVKSGVIEAELEANKDTLREKE